MIGHHPELGDEHRDAGRGAHPRQLLDHDRLGDVVGAGAAVGDGDAQGGQLHLDARLEAVPGERGVAVDVGRVGGDPLLGHLAHGTPELVVGVGEGEGGGLVHGPSLASRAARPAPRAPRSASAVRGEVLEQEPVQLGRRRLGDPVADPVEDLEAVRARHPPARRLRRGAPEGDVLVDHT